MARHTLPLNEMHIGTKITMNDVLLPSRVDGAIADWDPKGGPARSAGYDLDLAITFLRGLRPAGVLVLTAIAPAGGPPECRSFDTSADGVWTESRAWLAARVETRNLYYEVNPAKTMRHAKSTEAEILRGEFLYS